MKAVYCFMLFSLTFFYVVASPPPASINPTDPPTPATPPASIKPPSSAALPVSAFHLTHATPLDPTTHIQPTQIRRYETSSEANGCSYNGQIYPLGSVIKMGRWHDFCWKTSCHHSGFIIQAYYWCPRRRLSTSTYWPEPDPPTSTYWSDPDPPSSEYWSDIDHPTSMYERLPGPLTPSKYVPVAPKPSKYISKKLTSSKYTPGPPLPVYSSDKIRPKFSSKPQTPKATLTPSPKDRSATSPTHK